jgi:hypothetical protein
MKRPCLVKNFSPIIISAFNVKKFPAKIFYCPIFVGFELISFFKKALRITIQLFFNVLNSGAIFSTELK